MGYIGLFLERVYRTMEWPTQWRTFTDRHLLLHPLLRCINTTIVWICGYFKIGRCFTISIIFRIIAVSKRTIMAIKRNNPIWVMSSAFDKLTLPELVKATLQIGAQGIDLCVFRRDGTRQDHTATHLDYGHFTPDTAKELIDSFNAANLRLSLGAFENMIGGDLQERVKNQNHLLKLIRIAHLLGGDGNDVKVGTFVGYNHELGAQAGGFQKNLEEYQRVFAPIIRYAEDLGVTILYENCPMEGWRPASYTTTYNNLPGVLAARKLMYELIPSTAHGEIYDPS